MANEWGGMSATFGTSVPDVFADEAAMFDIINGTIRITFAVAAAEEPAAPTAMVMANIGRLIMPIQSAQRMSLALYDFLKQRDLDPSVLVSGDQQAN